MILLPKAFPTGLALEGVRALSGRVALLELSPPVLARAI
jgi:hypothetical protein